MVEENTAVGNANGIFLTAGVQGNILRANVLAGNPAVQISVDHPSTSTGFDILNLANAGANAFEGNTCLTSVNAPCPSLGPTFTASPNPIPVTSNAIVGQTTLSWNAPGAQVIEIHVGSPTGPLFTNQGNRGSAQTGVWVGDATTFYLQDVTGGNPLTSDYTLATLVVHLQRSGTGAMFFHQRTPPYWWSMGAAGALMSLLLGLICRRSRRGWLRTALAGTAVVVAILFIFTPTKAQSQPSTQQTAATLDRMIAAHKSPQELAQYVFDTHGCKSCHTVGQNGKLGLTSRGRQTAGNFEGCIRLLTDMNLVVQTPDDRRSPEQRQKVAHFQEFGCTTCHKVGAGKLSLTAVGSKLAHMHLGCVDIEKQLASNIRR